MSKEKIVLAYSGGLDTSIILTWLKEKYDSEIIAVCLNAGQKEDYDAIEKKAYATGASKSYIIDIQEEFVADFIWPTLKAGAIYENDYLLADGMDRIAALGNGQVPRVAAAAFSILAEQLMTANYSNKGRCPTLIFAV